MTRSVVALGLALAVSSMFILAQQATPTFSWPNSKRVAVSLSFDDARASQVEGGTALLDRYGVKATFYVVPSAVEKKLDGWKQAVRGGHEIGNHSLNHPCSGNFAWSRAKALEDYTTDQMRRELTDANRRINEYCQKALGLPDEKVHNNIQKYGNTTAATIPLLWNDVARSGRLRSGDLVLMLAFGAGMGWGALLLRA